MKRLFTYELNVSTFNVEQNQKQGNFKSMQAKLNYFKLLNTNVIFVKDILKDYENVTDIKIVNDKNGSLSDFINLVNNFKKEKIFISPIIDLKKLKKTFLNWKNLMSLYSSMTNDKTTQINFNMLESKYILNNIDPNNNIVDLANFILYFDKIINFYNECNVQCFTLVNFEHLLFGSKNINKNLQRLEDLYKMIKRINPNALVILKSSKYNKRVYSQIFKQYKKGKCADYLYVNHFALNGINLDLPYAKIPNFNYAKFLSQYKFLSQSPFFIMSLGSSLCARINSLWGNEQAYNWEAAKTLLLRNLASKSSFGLYYGDELGMLNNIDIKSWDENNINRANEEKRFYESKKIPFDKYSKAKRMLSSDNANNVLKWDNDKKIYEYPLLNSLNSDKNNIENELSNKMSPLQFLLNMNSFFELEGFKNDYDFINIKIKSNLNKNIFIITLDKHVDPKMQVIFVINLANKNNSLLFIKNKLQVVQSSYFNKIYTEIPKKLSPFESIVFIKK